MSASPKNNNINIADFLYDINGELLKTLEPKMSSLFDVEIPPDGRFVAVCGFAGEEEWSLLMGASADRVRLAMSPSVNDVHGDQRIPVINYSPCGRLIATCGDRYVRVFRNIPEYHSQNLKDVTGDAPRRRMLKQIEETRQILEKYCV
ncbi:unnamed protein product [Haemonchus placei]|uniref:WD_REPEATS_REGION domain-containing protein n=1 Tax=Haemonchus placei TaxID=6290 RepID=A0A0N4WCP4_HAEPC|nr:unnamed protein product [Haemonchus placei]